MENQPSLLKPDESVLPTLNQDGSRHWIRPKLSKGPFYTKRLIVAWALIVIFVAIPHVYYKGKPLILLDVINQHFTLFGTTFLATDIPLLMLVLLGIFLSIFLFTALFGRVWCGWSCPQTVYMEFLFRPLERLIEGPPRTQKKLDKEGANGRRILKNIIFFAISIALAHTFLAYFVGAKALWQWLQRSPLEHPTAFLVMAGTSCAVFFDFAYFREQTCIVACPYGRFQSAFLDSSSIIVAYDPGRGENRGKARDRRENKETEFGDCIDCGACVITCPTGIDIRDGLQMECINCTQCIDACDAIMEKISKPKGLIRYTSEEELEGKPKQLLRGRTLAYPLLIAVVFGLLGFSLLDRKEAKVSIFRGGNAPFTTLQDGRISNQVQLKISNQSRKDRKYKITLNAPKGVQMLAPLNPLPVDSSQSNAATIFVLAPAGLFKQGHLGVSFTIEAPGVKITQKHQLMGPK